MKIKKARLREIVRGIVEEAAKDGQIQKIYRRSFTKTIKMVSKGGNENTPPFTKKSSKPGKSGPPPISEQNDILLEGFERALAEGKVGDWVAKNLGKLKPVLKTFKEKLAAGVEPFTIAVQKWKAGEKLSEIEKKNFIKALTNAGIMLLPGGTLLVLLKHLVVNQIGGIA